jgi:hypothetical protein
MRCARHLCVGIVCLPFLSIMPAPSRATVVWNESSNGDLSNSGVTPTAITFSAGINSIIGSVGPGDADDWVGVTIPAGMQLSNDTLAAYSSTDAQGFTGVLPGSSYSGSINTASSYLGYAHFGTGATNTGLPLANLIGVDLLPIMGSTSAAPGSQGFTPPLPAGQYIFLIQQLGAATSYQFDYNVTAVPEPTCLALLAVAAPLLRRRR